MARLEMDGLPFRVLAHLSQLRPQPSHDRALTMNMHMPFVFANFPVILGFYSICASEPATLPLPCSIGLTLSDANNCYLQDSVPAVWIIKNEFTEDVSVSIGIDGPEVRELTILPSGKLFPENALGLTHEPYLVGVGQMYTLRPGESLKKTIILNKYLILEHIGEQVFIWRDTFLCIYPKSRMYENLTITGSVSVQVHPGSSPNIKQDISNVYDEFNSENYFEKQRYLFNRLYYERSPEVIPFIIKIFMNPPRAFAHSYIQLIDTLDALRSYPDSDQFIDNIFNSLDEDGVRCIYNELVNMRLRNEILPLSLLRKLFVSKNKNIEIYVADYLSDILSKISRNDVVDLIDKGRIPLNEIRALSSNEGTYLSKSIARLLHVIDPREPILPELQSLPPEPPPQKSGNPHFNEDGLRLGRPGHYENKF